MTRLRRSAAVVASVLGVLGLVSLQVSAATTLGGVGGGTLAATQGNTQRINGVQLDWTPVAVASTWTVGGLAVSTDPGESFATGDRVKVALVTSDASCEVSTTAGVAGARVSLSQSAITAACGQVGLDGLRSVAVSVTGDGLATSFSGNLGTLRGSLASFGGAVLNPQLSLKASAATTIAGGVSYVGTVTVSVTGGSVTAAALAGTQALLQFYGSGTGKLVQYSGTVSLDSSAAIRASSDSGTGVTVTIDTAALAGSGRPRTSEVDTFSVALNSPQHLGAPAAGSAGPYALSLVSGTIDNPSPAAKWAVDAVNLDSRLSYQYSETETNENNGSLSFCHSFTVTNTSSSAVDWRLTFDTSLPPLWGFNPLSGGFRSAWGWDTVSYSASTRLWTIGGPFWARTLASKQSVTAGYCVDNVPVPAADTTTVSYGLRTSSSSNAWFAAVDLSVTSTSRWNVPWQITFDLADYVCPAGLQGRTVTWAPTVQVVSVRGTVYTLRGVAGWNTRYVSASKPLSLASVAAYSPANGQHGSNCQSSSTTRIAAGASTPVPSASLTPAPSPVPTETSVEPTASATGVPTSPAVPTPGPTPSPTASPAAEPTPSPTPTQTATTGSDNSLDAASTSQEAVFG